MVRRVRRVNVVIEVSLRPRWCQFIAAGLYDTEVSERMELQAEAALRQFVREDFVTITAHYDDGSGEKRSIIRERNDFNSNRLPIAVDGAILLAENRALRARIMLLEMALEQHGVRLSQTGQTIAPHSPQP